MAKVYATPGVYIEEKSAFPNSAVPVATAVPAFIGYTEKAVRDKKDITHIPTRLSSFGEYLLFFGGAPKTTYDIENIRKKDPNEIYKLDHKNKRFFLFNCIRMFFANGGSDCYIVSVGNYDSTISAGDFSGEKIVDGEKKLLGINTLLKEPEPTMLVIPDAVLLPEADCFSLQQLMLQHCGAEMRNRVAILDVYDGFKKRSRDKNDVVDKFRAGVGNNFLDFASAYYPWLYTTTVSQEEVNFLNIDESARSVFIDLLKKDNEISIKEGVLTQSRANLINAEIDAIPAAALHAGLNKVFMGFGKFIDELKGLEQEDLDEAIKVLEAAGDDPAAAQNALGATNFGKMVGNIPAQTIAAIKELEAFATDEKIPEVKTNAKADAESGLKTVADQLSELAEKLAEGDLNTVAKKLKGLSANLDSAAQAVGSLKDDAKEEDIKNTIMKMMSSDSTDLSDVRDDIKQIQEIFSQDETLKQIKELNEQIPATADDLKNTDLEQFKMTITGKVEEALKAKKDVKTLHQTLLAISPLYKGVLNSLREHLNLLPPSACMAGVYSMVDNSIGVFQSPANVSVGSVVRPAVNLTNDEQEDLNVPLSGKAVNAIRTFPGKGVLVWGARTLDGNSQDWRYISVRRTMIFIEQSIKYAAEAYVFEPNTAATWTNIKALITNFLTNVWQQGALAGASAEDAFSVDVGLGTTMTAVDILDGIMRITVKLAVTRPAEFIVITFQQKMQQS